MAPPTRRRLKSNEEICEYWSVFWVCAIVVAGCTQDSGVKVYNTAPSISITSPVSGSELAEDEVLTLEAFASDDATDAENLMVDFSSDLDGALSRRRNQGETQGGEQ